MNIGIDIRSTLKKPTGIGQYTLGLLKGLTVHDLRFKAYPRFYDKSHIDYRDNQIKRVLETAQRITCVSNNTKKDLIKFYPSSKTCSVCGVVKSNLKLSERKFVCQMCGLVIDRDENAALNLKYLATVSSTGSNACGDTSEGGTGSNLRSRSQVSWKQEADTKYCL